MGCSPWDRKELDMTEQLTLTYLLTYLHIYFPLNDCHMQIINYPIREAGKAGSLPGNTSPYYIVPTAKQEKENKFRLENSPQK